MKKIQIANRKFILISTLIVSGLLVNACGSSTNNVSPVTATQSPGTVCTTNCTTTSPGTVYSSCTSYGGQMTTVTSGGSNVQVCRYEAASGSFDYPNAVAMNITAGYSASAGTITNLQLDPGDDLEVLSVGHYTWTGGVCDSNNGGGDISVLGNSNGKDPTTNPSNGLNVGLWFAFENSSGQYTTPVNANVQYSSSTYNQTPQSVLVPMGSTTNNLVMGYNSSKAIGCGDMGIYYAVIRCADVNGNTYTCN